MGPENLKPLKADPQTNRMGRFMAREDSRDTNPSRREKFWVRAAMLEGPIYRFNRLSKCYAAFLALRSNRQARLRPQVG